jgi:hypothetical protein
MTEILPELQSASDNGVVALYFTIPVMYPPKNSGKPRWKTVAVLVDYDINKLEIVKIYRWQNKVKGIEAQPRESELGGRRYFVQGNLPPKLWDKIKRQVKYLRLEAKKR